MKLWVWKEIIYDEKKVKRFYIMKNALFHNAMSIQQFLVKKKNNTNSTGQIHKIHMTHSSIMTLFLFGTLKK